MNFFLSFLKKNIVKIAVVSGAFIAVILAMATSIVPLQVASVTGALFIVITKCLTEQQAYRGIDWVTIFLFAVLLRFTRKSAILILILFREKSGIMLMN